MIINVEKKKSSVACPLAAAPFHLFFGCGHPPGPHAHCPPPPHQGTHIPPMRASVRVPGRPGLREGVSFWVGRWTEAARARGWRWGARTRGAVGTGSAVAPERSWPPWRVLRMTSKLGTHTWGGVCGDKVHAPRPPFPCAQPMAGAPRRPCPCPPPSSPSPPPAGVPPCSCPHPTQCTPTVARPAPPETSRRDPVAPDAADPRRTRPRRCGIAGTAAAAGVPGHLRRGRVAQRVSCVF